MSRYQQASRECSGGSFQKFSDFYYLSANREQGTMGGGIRCEDRGEHTMQGIWDNGRQDLEEKF